MLIERLSQEDPEAVVYLNDDRHPEAYPLEGYCPLESPKAVVLDHARNGKSIPYLDVRQKPAR